MTERPQGEPSAHDDRTRDIRLPPLPDRPSPALPPQWAELHPPAPAATPDFSAPAPELPTTAATAAEPAPQVQPEGRPLPAWARGVEDGPTDQLEKPERPPRERTLAFNWPEMAQRPVSPVQVGRSPRRWPWVVLVVLPLLVIIGAAVTLVLLFQAG